MPVVKCSECPTTFEIAQSHLDRLSRPPTCSVECKHQSMKGNGHWHWRGGRYEDSEGYIRVLVDGVYQMEHRVVMAKKLGRPLRDDELVRHKDGNRQNNKLRNLALLEVATRPVKATVRRKARRAA